MGSSFEVKCPQCGYATRSSCGRDYGMMAVVETHICQDCKELTDVLIGEQGRVFNKRRLTKTQKEDYYCCGICGSPNIKVWDVEAQPCPKCGARLTKPDEPDVLWD